MEFLRIADYSALHLKGKTIRGHQGLMKIKGDQQITLEEYSQFMGSRFGAHGCDDPLSDL